MRSGRDGFTLLELLVFAGIFTIVIIGFLTILVAVVRVQSRQYGAADVNQQSQFLLQQFQYYIESSSLVDMPQDVPSSALRLRMSASAEDPTIVSLAGGVVYLKRGAGAEQALTSGRVTVSSLVFTKRSNPPGHDSVDIAFTLEHSSPGVARIFSQSLRTSVARVNAASFDSNVSPGSTDAYIIGSGVLRWDSINDVIYFSNTNPPNVGIGVSSPNARLQVNGGDIYVDSISYGLVLRDSAGKCWRIQPSLTGAFAATQITSYGCPP